MKIKLIGVLGLFLAAKVSCAQFINDGGTVIIGNGSLLVVNSNFENKNGGSVTNDGKLEVKGNFSNSAVYTSTGSDDSLLVTGINSSSLVMTSSTLNNIWINKSGVNVAVTMQATTNSLNEVVVETIELLRPEQQQTPGDAP